MPRGLGKPQKPPRHGRSSAEGREARGWGLPPPAMPRAPITRPLAGGRSGPGRARNSNYFLRSCRTGLPLRARPLWGRVLGATALRRPGGCSPVPPEQPQSLKWGQAHFMALLEMHPHPGPRAVPHHATGLLGHQRGEIGVKGQKAGLGQAARDVPEASPAAQPRGPDPSGQGPQQGAGDSGRSHPTQRPLQFVRRKRGYR